jgi:hypothetical protein
MLEQPCMKDFAPYLQTRFTLAEPANYELELEEVADHSNAQLEQSLTGLYRSRFPMAAAGVLRAYTSADAGMRTVLGSNRTR